jgi:hypothetical protein
MKFREPDWPQANSSSIELLIIEAPELPSGPWIHSIQRLKKR